MELGDNLETQLKNNMYICYEVSVHCSLLNYMTGRFLFFFQWQYLWAVLAEGRKYLLQLTFKEGGIGLESS